MKKTLIALAAVAVSSAAMAQVTVSGTVDARYESLTTNVTAVTGAYVDSNGAIQTLAAGVALPTGGTLLRAAVAGGPTTTKGFQINDAFLTFTANEDLGGGTKATARFTIDGATSDGSSVFGDGVSLTLANANFGSVSFSSVESSDYLAIDAVTKISAFANGTVADRVTYTSPAISGFTFSATMQEGGSGAGSTKTGEANVYELSYAAGPLTANVGMLSVDKNVHASTDGGTRFKVGYNLGVAAVTYGVVNTKDKDGVKDKETGLTVSVPMGATTLGYQYVTAKDGAAAALKGTGITAAYALSKRSSLNFEQVNYDQSASFKAKRTRFTVRHTF
jgi:predicted porin